MKAVRKPVNLFFIELIISLLVFSISSAVILKVFAAADAKSRKSTLFESVVITAQSAAEVYSRNGDLEEVAELVFGRGADTDGEISIEGGRVKLKLSEERSDTGAGELRELNMRFYDEDGELYSLDCSVYITGGGNDG